MKKGNSKTKDFGIPKNIPELETIGQTNQKFLDAWVNYFKNLSPRIKIIFPGDKNFNFEDIKTKTAALKNLDPEDKGKIIWPDEKLAFMLIFDANVLGDKPEYFVRNTYLFYFGDIAFSLHHFEVDSVIIDEGDAFTATEYEYLGTYSLSSYSEDLLEWKFIATLIKSAIRDIENKVPSPPDFN